MLSRGMFLNAVNALKPEVCSVFVQFSSEIEEDMLKEHVKNSISDKENRQKNKKTGIMNININIEGEGEGERSLEQKKGEIYHDDNGIDNDNEVAYSSNCNTNTNNNNNNNNKKINNNNNNGRRGAASHRGVGYHKQFELVTDRTTKVLEAEALSDAHRAMISNGYVRYCSFCPFFIASYGHIHGNMII